MTFQNLEQVKKELNLTGDDPKEMQKKLRRLMGKWHPDKHGGENSMPQEIREKFLKANEAYQFLEKYVSEHKAIVPANEVTELVKLIRDLALVNKKEDKVASSESRLSERIEKGLNQLGRQYLTPKITVSAIVTALTAIWFLPETISEKPILRFLFNVDSGVFFMEWIISLVIMVFVLYGTSVSEESQKHFQSQLKTERFQNEIFTYFSGQTTNGRFSKGRFVHFLTTTNFRPYISGSNYSSEHHSLQLLPSTPLIGHMSQLFGATPLAIDPETAQIIADIVFERAEVRGFIAKDEKAKHLEDVYYLTSEETN